MNIEKKIRLLTIAVLVLIATNAATIATIFIHPFSSEVEDVRTRRDMHERFKAAGFSPKQMNMLKQTRGQWRDENRTAMQRTKELRHALHQQLLSETPDTAEMSRLIIEIGKNYQKMKRLSVKQFLMVKPHCTKEQLHMLLQGDEQMPRGEGKGKHRGQDNNQCE
ncbi:hypothetical protein [Williamwhitmania taraxaci]|uniref:Heavy-metal resistance n=1 Tax=Williamwhitmania taraxaci TaxID=1640674 RepID=A0A1G6H7K4_9BACT|nr:hypothetical protein [Williamwhitmania taraxaci]SDB89416.1 hypothetical protein SAMN05216323_100726 [Williamwhitmania taraxaci]